MIQVCDENNSYKSCNLESDGFDSTCIKSNTQWYSYAKENGPASFSTAARIFPVRRG